MRLAEGVQLVSFVILTVIVLGGALGVVLLPNMVYAAFLLGFVFIGIAGLYILLNADFVAAAQILIYVGAVNVLILFAIMLVNRRIVDTQGSQTKIRSGLTFLVCTGLFVLLAFTINGVAWSVQEPVSLNTVVEIGKRFFGEFLLPFEVVSLLLLVALVGAIVLARREFIPEPTEGSDPLALPERPREEIELDQVPPKLPAGSFGSGPRPGQTDI